MNNPNKATPFQLPSWLFQGVGLMKVVCLAGYTKNILHSQSILVWEDHPNRAEEKQLLASMLVSTWMGYRMHWFLYSCVLFSGVVVRQTQCPAQCQDRGRTGEGGVSDERRPRIRAAKIAASRSWRRMFKTLQQHLAVWLLAPDLAKVKGKQEMQFISVRWLTEQPRIAGEWPMICGE